TGFGLRCVIEEHLLRSVEGELTVRRVRDLHEVHRGEPCAGVPPDLLAVVADRDTWPQGAELVEELRDIPGPLLQLEWGEGRGRFGCAAWADADEVGLLFELMSELDVVVYVDWFAVEHLGAVGPVCSAGGEIHEAFALVRAAVEVVGAQLVLDRLG